MTMPGFHGLSMFAVLKRAISDFMADDMTTYASALAYQVLFSIFPFLIFLIALIGFLHMPAFFDWLKMQMDYMLPDQAMSLVNQVLDELQKEKASLLSGGMIVAIWTASAGVRATIHALNIAYNVRERRPAWKLYPLSIIYTIGIASMLIVAAALMVIGPQAVQWAATWIGLEQTVVTAWALLRWPVALVLLMLVVAVVYYVGPNRRQKFHFFSPGSVLSVLVWVLASVGFEYYVRSFADYSVMYGSIGTIIVLLLYFFVSAAVLLFGAEVNATVESMAKAQPKTEPAEAAAGQHTSAGNGQHPEYLRQAH